jgi:hypothetical protein
MAQSQRRDTRVDYDAKGTRDHTIIRQWAERRGGRPAMVEGTQALRINFDELDEDLNPVSWGEFFRVFDERGLQLLYQEQTHDGKISHFNKLVNGQSEEGHN